jgi:hypothetical protein
VRNHFIVSCVFLDAGTCLLNDTLGTKAGGGIHMRHTEIKITLQAHFNLLKHKSGIKIVLGKQGGVVRTGLI